MSEPTNRNADGDAAKQGGVSTSRLGRLAGRFLAPKWIALLLGTSIVVHGFAFTYYRITSSPPARPHSPEVSLGAFEFDANRSEGGPIAGAEFSLHIALLDRVDQSARRLLKSHRFRVQQDVEQLLRHAHSGDFEDPGLKELKRQVQEQINQTLGIRAIADVIVTDLDLQYRRTPAKPSTATETAERTPWAPESGGRKTEG